MKNKKRCAWPGNNELMIEYHDNEWGVPTRDDKILFEFLILDTFQAGLSWAIILNKRENFRKAFSNFNPKIIAKYDDKKKQSLLENSGIVRNRLKIDSAVNNSKLFLGVQKEFGSFANYLWDFVDGKPKINKWKKMNQLPSTDIVSDSISKDMKKRGFKFVGSTVVYAWIQSAGLINDHLIDCFRYNELTKK